MATLLRTRDLVLPPRGALPQFADDPLEHYYKPLIGPLYRGRLRVAKRLLGSERRRALLDVGLGSGIFLPELARYADRLVGVDVHPEVAAVDAALAALDVDAELREASLYELPFGDGEFDALVCLSVLEHLTDLTGALAEMRRVLAPGGVVVLGFPVRNPITDTFFRAVGYDPRAIHPSGHGEILAAAHAAPGLRVARVARMPWFLPLPLAAYAACRCEAD